MAEGTTPIVVPAEGPAEINQQLLYLQKVGSGSLVLANLHKKLSASNSFFVQKTTKTVAGQATRENVKSRWKM